MTGKTHSSENKPGPAGQEPVLLRLDGDNIATLTLNRPDKYNALSGQLLDALKLEIDAIAADPSVRVVVISAAGKSFSAGHDLKELLSPSGHGEIKEMFERCSTIMASLTRLPQPVIARVQGVATAAGCQLVTMCDLAIAADDARFATSGINLGLFCSTPMVGLSRDMGRKKAMEMLLTGDFIDAQTALAAGLVNQVAPLDELDEAVGEMAKKITAKSPAAVAMGKRLFYRQLEAPLGEAFELANETMTLNMELEDTREGIGSFIDKRPPPDWKDRLD
ncbi:MAG: enoyl-CoA hydratase [Rhodospirillales bacterium]